MPSAIADDPRAAARLRMQAILALALGLALLIAAPRRHLRLTARRQTRTPRAWHA